MLCLRMYVRAARASRRRRRGILDTPPERELWQHHLTGGAHPQDVNGLYFVRAWRDDRDVLEHHSPAIDGIKPVEPVRILEDVVHLRIVSPHIHALIEIDHTLIDLLTARVSDTKHNLIEVDVAVR